LARVLALRIRSRLPGPFGSGALAHLPAGDEIPGARVLDRRLLRLAAPIALGALALTACGSSSGGSSSSGGGKKTYTIAYQGPLSGDNAQLGINMDNGVKLALDQAKGLPFNLKFTDSDDVGDPAQAPAAARKLLDNSNVVAVVGPAFSGATAASEPLFSQADLVSVSPSATRADLTHLGFKSFVRVVTGDTIQGAQMADYVAKALKAKTAYVVDDKSPYGAGLTKFVKEQLTTDGVTFKSEGLAPTKDYSAIATKAVASKSDVLVYGGYFAELALFVKALKSAGFKGAIVSGDGSKDDQLVKQAGAAAENVYLTCACGGPTPAGDATVEQFGKDYQAKFGSPPGTYSAEAFDAANLIIAAMKGLGSDITRSSITAAVKKTSGFKGVSHTITFDQNGEGGAGQIFMHQVKGGKITLLGDIAELAK
ncbi:MAG: branched-chain amino acid transport system substrate-binding protein, partial [Actinomycetota bacterium]|nr:branched-chain amino acid transport system substrate-binding protein [Actinomycetota bacterium]